MSDSGFIGFSKKRKNQVVSNVAGAAAFNGNLNILKAFVKKSGHAVNIDYLASEKKDFQSTTTFNQEYTGYTPLMLSVVGGGQNLECTKFLLSHHAALTLTDPVDNTILHLATLHSNHLALDFLLDLWFKTASLDTLGSRNKKGETLFSIAS